MNNIENITAVLNAKELNPRIKMFKELKYITQYSIKSIFSSSASEPHTVP